MPLALLLALLCAPVSRTSPAQDDASSWNRIGLAHIEGGRFEGAVAAFEKARARAPESPAIQSNLAVALLERGRQQAQAGRLIQAVSDFARGGRLLPDHVVFPLEEAAIHYRRGEHGRARSLLAQAQKLEQTAMAEELLGCIHYLDDDFERALRHLGEARRLAPERAELRALHERVLREHEHEADFLVKPGRRFQIAYDARGPGLRQERTVRALLESVHVRICRELGGRPQGVTRVVLYAQSQFPEATEAQRWVRGLFDGKIRVPLSPTHIDELELKRTLAHEYTHCVLHSLWADAPAWVHEGLAQELEPNPRDPDPTLRILLQTGASFPGPRELPRSFLLLKDQSDVELCYLVAQSFVRYLRKRFAASRLRVFLARAGEGEELEAAFAHAFSVNFREAVQGWSKSIGGTLR